MGKTTVMKVLVTVWERLGGNVMMGALARKAALQLSRGASTPARPRARVHSRVTSLDDDIVHVLWDGENSPRALSLDAGADIELAYAITCHRAQGLGCVARCR